ncbi:MAG TPA: porin family protein [Vicinamibacterales bacterium]|nr:porin family protein [Vicinamibacterales bacterium]
MFMLAVAGGVRDAAAQIKPGVLIGVNSASLTIPETFLPVEDLDLTVNVKRRTGLIVGGFVDVPVGKTLALEVGALFSQKGSATVISIPGVVSGSADTRIQYLDIPILGVVSVAKFSQASVHLLAGPSIGVKIGARLKATVEGQSETQDINDEIPSTDVGLVLGARVEFSQGVLAEFRYTHGLTDLSDTDESVKNRVFSFLVGYRFGSSK